MKPMSQEDMEKVMEGLRVLVEWIRGSAEDRQVQPAEEGRWTHVPEAMNVKELAEFMNISQWSAYELCRTTGFPAVRIGRRVLVRKDQLMAWMDKEAGTGNASKYRIY